MLERGSGWGALASLLSPPSHCADSAAPSSSPYITVCMQT